MKVKTKDGRIIDNPQIFFKHKLICGDSSNAKTIQRLISNDKIKLIFTSPPYNMASNIYEKYNDNLNSQEFINLNIKTLTNLQQFLSGFVFWNLSYNKKSREEFIEIMYEIIKKTGLKFLELIVWNKKTALPINSNQQLTRQYEDILVSGTEDAFLEDLELFTISTTQKTYIFNKKTNKILSNYWEIRPNNIQSKLNSACFPVELPARAIRLMTEKDDIIIDPFAGSGTTLIAAEQLGRRCYLIELIPEMCSAIIERFEKFTNKRAIKL